MKKRTCWSDEEKAAAIQLHKEGLSFPEIALYLEDEFGIARTPYAIDCQLERMRNGDRRAPALRQKQKTEIRKCLRCRKEFASEGAHNRLCGPCRTAATNNTEIDNGGADTYALGSFRGARL